MRQQQDLLPPRVRLRDAAGGQLAPGSAISLGHPLPIAIHLTRPWHCPGATGLICGVTLFAAPAPTACLLSQLALAVSPWWLRLSAGAVGWGCSHDCLALQIEVHRSLECRRLPVLGCPSGSSPESTTVRPRGGRSEKLPPCQTRLDTPCQLQPTATPLRLRQVRALSPLVSSGIVQPARSSHLAHVFLTGSSATDGS